jgi:hypothetical protein
MSAIPIVLACRDANEAEILKSSLKDADCSIHHRGDPALANLEARSSAVLVVTSFLSDETAIGLITRASIIGHYYSIVVALHAASSLNLLRLYAAGCVAILGPNELDLFQKLVNPPKVLLEKFVVPPFFIEVDPTTIKDNPRRTRKKLHITCLGIQSLMSCCNALINIPPTENISIACMAPFNTWARAKISKDIAEFSLWRVQYQPAVVGATLTLCHDFKVLSSLDPTAQHVILCHGMLTRDEEAYLRSVATGSRVFNASHDGYRANGDEFGEVISPKRLWTQLASWA